MEKAILVIEKEITFTFDPKDVAMILLSAFYVFTMHYNYTEGCTNFYSALEALLLNQKTPNRKTCSNFKQQTCSNFKQTRKHVANCCK